MGPNEPANEAPKFTIVLGNKSYSSWSLRGWLALAQCGVPFDEVVVPLRRSDTVATLAPHSPSGKVPVLKVGALTLWDSLAIGEYLAERFPNAGLWPSDSTARAFARCVVAEMHSSFPAIRTLMPMNLRELFPGSEVHPTVAADIARIVEVWTQCREQFGGSGDFLFGAFSLADAAFAPVVTRLVTYDVALEGVAARYRDAVMAHEPLIRWREAALEEPWTIDYR